MPSLSQKTFLLVGLLAVATDAYAQSRGGSCRGALCDVTGLGVFLILLGLLAASVAGSIKRKGLIKGFFGHAGVQAVLGYVAMLSIVVGIPLTLMTFFGKEAAMWSIAGLVAVSIWLLRHVNHSGTPRKGAKNDTKV